jgi:hypothetical protein
VKLEEKSTLKVGTKPWLINRNTPFSDSVVTAQLNVLITINMSNYRHYLMTEFYWNMNIIHECHVANLTCVSGGVCVCPNMETNENMYNNWGHTHTHKLIGTCGNRVITIMTIANAKFY